ncbi:MAG: type II toxin-antitoxin system VapC family toxin [Planctomycetota bacterium]
MIVLDASAAVELLLGTPAAERIGHRVRPATESLHAPHLIDVEVAHVLRRYVSIGSLSERRARTMLRDYEDLNLRRYPHDALLPRVWQLRRNVTAYDAVYLVLAEVLSAPLLTCDAKLAAVPGHRAQVELIGR